MDKKKSLFSDEQLKELHNLIRLDIGKLFFALFLKKKTWQSAMKESNIESDVSNLNFKINEIINHRIKELREKL